MFTSVSMGFSVPEAMQEWPVFCAFLPHSGKRLIRIYSQMKLVLWGRDWDPMSLKPGGGGGGSWKEVTAPFFLSN